MHLSRREFVSAVPSAALLAGLKSVEPTGDDPLGVRKDFPALRDEAFLNTTYIGLIPQAVVDAGHDWLESRARRTYSVQHMLERTDECRSRSSTTPPTSTVSSMCPRSSGRADVDVKIEAGPKV